MHIKGIQVRKYVFHYLNTRVEVNMQRISRFKILENYPELKSGGVGPYGITYLQVLCAITKIGEGQIRSFLTNAPEYINAADNLGRTALHYAAFNGNLELIKLLVEKDADINSNENFVMNTDRNVDQKWAELKNFVMEVGGLKKSFCTTGTPLHFAISGGSIDSALLLIESGANMFLKNSENVNPIEMILEHDERKFLDFLDLFLNRVPPPILDYKETVVNILLRFAVKLNKTTHMKHVLVHKVGDLGEMQFLAASLGHLESLKLLVLDGINFSYSKDDESLLDRIFLNIANPEEFVLKQLDERVTVEQLDPTTRRLLFDFTILAPTTVAQMEVLNSIGNASSAERLLDFLSHPLIEVFLKLKWEKVKKFFYLQIFTYSIFVLTLSSYVLEVVNENFLSTQVFEFIKYLLILSALTALIHAFLQIALSFRKSNSKYEILMSFSCAVLSLVIIFNDSGRPSQVPDWILHATSIAILLAWMQLMLLIGRLPTYGYYALMFTAVLQNVVKVLITFVCLLIGFALSFSIQFRDAEHFKNPWLSVFKTTVMMMGEYEYADLFADPNSRLSATSRVVFLLFVILVSIVLMNLMIGLAVNDIQGLQQEGHAKRCLKQADFLKNFEEVLRVLEKINSAFGNVFCCLVDFLERSAKLELKLVLDFNGKSNQNVGLKRDYIEQLLLRITKRNDNAMDFSAESFEKLLVKYINHFKHIK